MAISKVIYAGNTLIDLTNDTVDESKLLAGATAHGADGEPITGTCSYDADTKDATATAAEILKDKTAYKNGAKVTGTMPNNGGITGHITTKTAKVTIKQGYHDGSGHVDIASAEQEKLIAENIREGITILGVTGSMSGTEDATAQSKTVTPSTAQQEILPDSPTYNYLSSVIVNPIPYAEADNSAGGTTVTIG